MQSFSKPRAALSNQIWHWIWVWVDRRDKGFDLDFCPTQKTHSTRSLYTRNTYSVSIRKDGQFRGPLFSKSATSRLFRAFLRECAHLLLDQKWDGVCGMKRRHMIAQNWLVQKRNSKNLADTNPHLWLQECNMCPFLCIRLKRWLCLPRDTNESHRYLLIKSCANARSPLEFSFCCQQKVQNVLVLPLILALI